MTDLTPTGRGTFLEEVVFYIEKNEPCTWTQVTDNFYNGTTYPQTIELNIVLESAERLGLIHDIGGDRWERIVRYENAVMVAPPGTLSQNDPEEDPE